MIKSLIAATLGCAGLLGPAASQTQDLTTTEVGPWTMMCQADRKTCMVATRFKSDDEPDEVWATVGFSRRGKNLLIFVETPKLTEPQMELSLDDKFSGPTSATSCSDDACDFLIPLDAEDADKLGDTKVGTVAMSIRPNEMIGLRFELEGLREALAALPAPAQ